MRLAILVALALTGCAPTVVLLRGPGGDIKECAPNPGAVAYGGWVAGSASVHQCVLAWQGAGYQRLPAPTPTSPNAAPERPE